MIVGEGRVMADERRCRDDMIAPQQHTSASKLLVQHAFASNLLVNSCMYVCVCNSARECPAQDELAKTESQDGGLCKTANTSMNGMLSTTLLHTALYFASKVVGWGGRSTSNLLVLACWLGGGQDD